ncbi:MAG: hypothetical protein RL722_1013 [Pseudomonadota bacterium]|jgi:hypothetical protein
MMKSKTLTTWLALAGGSLGLDRLYLRRNPLEPWIWLHLVFTLLGVMGVQRMRALGVDDALAWVLIPLGGLSVSAALLGAIRNGLTSDEAWNARHNPGQADAPASGWANVIGVILSLLIGAVVLLSSITMAMQHYFEIAG